MDTPEPLATYAEIARDEIRRDFAIDSCIASTRITIEVMKNLGIRARPLSVEVMVFNKQFHETVQAEGWPTVTGKDFEDWCDRHGAWSVGIDRSQSRGEDRWPGHLTAVVGNKPYLVDASADQLNRPHKGIEMPGVFVTPLEQSGFVTGWEPMIFVRESEGEVDMVTRYMAFPKDKTYRNSRDWSDPKRFMPVVERILKRLDKTGLKR